MVFQCINIRQVPWEVLKTAAFGLGFQHLPRDLANVNAWKTMFDPYNSKYANIEKKSCYVTVWPAQSDQFLLVRVKKHLILCYPKCDQWRFWSDCASAQADLNLCWACLSEETFSALLLIIFYTVILFSLQNSETFYTRCLLLKYDNDTLIFPFVLIIISHDFKTVKLTIEYRLVLLINYWDPLMIQQIIGGNLWQLKCSYFCIICAAIIATVLLFLKISGIVEFCQRFSTEMSNNLHSVKGRGQS